MGNIIYLKQKNQGFLNCDPWGTPHFMVAASGKTLSRDARGMAFVKQAEAATECVLWKKVFLKVLQSSH